MIRIDQRWFGNHGIGRFAVELNSRLCMAPVGIGWVKPSSPFDFIFTSMVLCRYGNDYIFCPGYTAPICGLDRYAFVIHDLNHIEFQESTSFAKKAYYSFIIKRAVLKSACVMTVSEFSRRRIVDWAGSDEDKVINIGNGVSSVFVPFGPCFRPGYAYWLCVGNRRPHKNEVRVVEAFAKANLGHAIKLVFTGVVSTGLRHAIECCNVGCDVVFLGGDISDEDLAAVYRGAVGLVFPSLYEGFGLPVVEAMACGTPVVTSTVTALPEVAGGAALLVDPTSVDAIASAITKVTVDAGLRDRMRELGIKNANRFSWDNVAENVLNALHGFFMDKKN